jgi:hypothetical protein
MFRSVIRFVDDLWRQTIFKPLNLAMAGMAADAMKIAE